MAYEVTASRKRPKDFNGLVGQEFVVATLMNALKTGRIAHAYLFSGPRGVGKTSTARILARALNCPDADKLGSEGCYDYPGAEEISRGTALDVIEIDGASNTSVNDIRAIKDEVLFPPQSSRYKIYIIDEVHMLSNSAFNALLKTIEEPPHYIIFIFATTEIHKVPATIRSRCQQFNFRLIPMEEIIRLLAEACSDQNVTADEDALFWIARESTGSMRDAYTLLDQIVSFSEGNVSLDVIKEKLGLLGIDELNSFANHLVRAEREESLEYLDGMFSSGASVEQIIIDLSEYFRSLLFIKQGVKRDSLLGFPRNAFSETATSALTVVQIEKIIEMLLQSYRDIRYTLNSRLELEMLVSRLTRITSYFEPDELFAKIDNLRSQIAALPAGTQQPAVLDAKVDPTSPDQPTGHTEANTDAPQSADSPEPDSEQQDWSPSVWNEVVEKFQDSSPGLGAVLGMATNLNYSEGVLSLSFDSSLSVQTVQREQKSIAGQLSAALNAPVELSVNLLQEKAESEESDPDVEMVKKVFRGDLIN